MEADASGAKLNCRNCLSQSLPQPVSSTSTTSLIGMGLAFARSRESISASSGGSRSPASSDSSWPIFIAAPRKLAS